MTEELFDRDTLQQLDELIVTARNIVITCHLSPDGDAMGSSLGLRRALWRAGKKARFITPDTPPKYLQFLPGAEDIVVYSRSEAFADKAFAEAEGSKQHARPELSAMLLQKGCFKQRLQVGYGFCLQKSKVEL